MWMLHHSNMLRVDCESQNLRQVIAVAEFILSLHENQLIRCVFDAAIEYMSSDKRMRMKSSHTEPTRAPVISGTLAKWRSTRLGTINVDKGQVYMIVLLRGHDRVLSSRTVGWLSPD